MIPLREHGAGRSLPLLTYTLVALNVLIYLWDREFQIVGPSVVFSDLAMRPNELAAVFAGGDRFPLVTLFTSAFLHANLLHLLANLLFLYTFGPSVERALGPFRFALYYLSWGIVAGATHVFVDPASAIPTIGASGAIGGVLGAYFLLYPGNKIELLIPPLFIPALVRAWVLLGIWFLWQVFVPQEGVANWAHAGGFLAGMATVLVMGGRASIMKRQSEELDDFDFRTS